MRIAHDVKGFLKDSINRLTVITVCFGVVLSFGLYRVHQEVKNTQTTVTECEKKVDYRYFNLTRSLEDVHKVRIETHQGRVER